MPCYATTFVLYVPFTKERSPNCCQYYYYYYYYLRRLSERRKYYDARRLCVCVCVCLSVCPPSRDCWYVALVSAAKVMRCIQCCLAVIIIECCSIYGGELFDRAISEDFLLTEKACVCFMRQICEAVEFIHSKNIIHLDMKVCTHAAPPSL